jgi:hypothetical protein
MSSTCLPNDAGVQPPNPPRIPFIEDVADDDSTEYGAGVITAAPGVGALSRLDVGVGQ